MTALPRIGRPAERALSAQGITTLEQVMKLTEADLGAIHGVGPKAIGIIKAALDAEGKTLRP